MAAKLLGAHVPTGKGLGNAVRDGAKFGCTAIQVFTASPRMWAGSPATPEKIADLKKAREETGIQSLVSHDTYLVNLGHPGDEIRNKSLVCLKGEMERCGAYEIPYVVSHIGALMGQPKFDAFKRIVEATLEVLAETPPSVTLLMETTAGQGSSVNSEFEELAELMEACGNPARLAVCLDTCHVFAADYDIRDAKSYEKTMHRFDRIVGIERLKVIHCNDSKKGLGTRVDRHHNIGQGHIGIEAFRCLVNDPRFENIPILLETPTEEEGHEKDLALLKSLIKA